MNTFIPLYTYKDCAIVLDNKRLNKQITETLQIYKALNNPKDRWHNHPCTKMWKEYPYALVCYGIACYDEWQERLTNDKRKGKLIHKSGEVLSGIKNLYIGNTINVKSYPSWWDIEEIHSIYRAVLLDKNYEWYYQFNWKETPQQKISGKYPYIWS